MVQLLDLSLYPEFRADIQGNVTNIHPIAIIRSSPEIFLSQNNEVIEYQEELVSFNSMNLKIPSIKESVDLESRKLKVNNITLTLSNHSQFSNKFAQQNFLSAKVDVY